jgi:hypothetical protein
MNAKQLKEIGDNSHINSHKAIKESIRSRLWTAAANGFYKLTFDSKSYDGPFLLPESVRKAFLADLTKDGFVVECVAEGFWSKKTITISWENA